MIVVADRDFAAPWVDERARTGQDAAVAPDSGQAAGWRWVYLAPWFSACAAWAYVRCVAAEIRPSRRST